MTKEQIGHVLGSGFSGLSVLEFFAYLRGVGHQRDVYYDSLFFTGRRIELFDINVHRRIDLLAVNVPHGKSCRFSGVKQSPALAARDKRKKRCEYNRNDD